MNSLADFIASLVQNHVEHGYNASVSTEYRPVLRGMPSWLLHDVFRIFETLGGVSLNGESQTIPVFLVNARADDLPTMVTSSCTSNHLVAARNRLDCFLTLCPPGESVPKSMTTTMSFLDLTVADVTSVQEWITQPVVDTTLKRVFGEFPLPESLKRLFFEAATDADKRDSEQGNDYEKWRLLARICETPPDIDQLVACLGFPRAPKEQLGGSDQRSIVRRLAEFVETSGLIKGFESLCDRSPNSEVKAHLDAVKEHLIETCESAASTFAIAPARCYAPKPGQMPDWWVALDVDTWAGILDSPPDPEPEADLTVRPMEPLLPAVKGMPSSFADRFKVAVELPEGCGNVEVNVSRSVGQRAFEHVETLAVTSNGMEWHDDAPPAHDKFLRYRFEASGFKQVTIKAIVLSCYKPGVIPFARNAKKTTPFTFKKKARIEHSRRIEERYECDIDLAGMGTQQLDFYFAEQFQPAPTIRGFDFNADDEGSQGTDYPVNQSRDSHAVCLIEVDEECYYDLLVQHPDGTSSKHRLWMRADDVAPTGACSEFDRLVIENRTSAEREAARVEIVGSRSLDLEAWLLEEVDAAYPVVLGDDYRKAWKKPDFRNESVVSNRTFIRDARPPRAEFSLPDDLKNARARVLEELRAEAGNETPVVERVRLGVWLDSDDKRELLSRYVSEFYAWLDTEYDLAAWMDVVALHRSQDEHVLETYPYAILLSPIHPLRLAWQCRAQKILKDAIDAHAPCPAASALDPSTCPDCLALPCRTATGGTDHRVFVSVHNTSDYWSVLWSSRDVSTLDQALDMSIFDDDFGIRVDGLSAGFSTTQVEKSLEEVRRITSGQSILKVAVSSDTTGSSSCNQGIDNWSSQHLGEINDPWYAAGGHILDVHDERPESQHPEPSELASLTERTDGALKWFRDSEERPNEMCDITIVAHLGCDSPEFSREGLTSPIDPSGLLRNRVRRQVPQDSGVFIAESRVGKRCVVEGATDPLAQFIGNTCVTFESACRDNCDFDSFVFAPRISTLDRALQRSRYCAVSSTNVDPACFFGPSSQSYLWDYELPSFGRRVGESSGFYLLAAERPGMLLALRSSLQQLNVTAEIDDNTLRSLLHEISRRGMPTLRRLTSGGAAALGELGMLIALRLLQSEFSIDRGCPGVVPVLHENDVVNLVVPVDPFLGHIDSLRAALDLPSRERPDLLVMSIRLQAGLPVSLRLSPVEVKARSAKLTEQDKLSAIGQASELATMLNQVRQKAHEHELWGIAWRHLLTTWLTYAFRVYGQLPEFMNYSEWALLHSKVLTFVCSCESEQIQVDNRGRLVVIEDSTPSRPFDVDGDGFKETIRLSRSDAATILLESDPSIQRELNNRLGTWELVPKDEGSLGNDNQGGEDESERVANVLQVPTVRVPGTQEPDVAQGPEGADDGILFAVGRSKDAFNAHDMLFHPSNTDLTQLNIGIVGNLGTGKTQLLKSLLYQLCLHPEKNRGIRPRILIFDYKKDYSEANFVQALGATVVTPMQIPLNLFDITDCTNRASPWLERARFFTDVLDKIYSNIGAVQKQRIKNAVRRSYDEATAAGRPAPTIYDVFDNYSDLCEGNIDTPFSIMSDMVDMQLFDRDPKNILPFSQFFNGVTVINLGDLGQDDQTKNMLVAILLNLFYEHMLKIEKRGFVGQDPTLRAIDSLLLVDEADNIMKFEFDVLRKILLQGREFGVGVILASQYLSHFKTRHEDYREPLLSWFVHQVPNITVKELQAIGIAHADTAMVNEVKGLACHECLYKSYGVDEGEFMRGHPFFELMNRIQN